MEEYLKNGRDIYNKYCSEETTEPIMLPRAPQQTYIDLYHNSEEPGHSFRDDIARQSDYETEVQVYRALEKLELPLIVLHNFQYTHHQYRFCNRAHIRKGCVKCSKKNAGNMEGECDFLIAGPGYFVIIEVKNMSHVGDVVECEPEFHLCTILEGSREPGCNKERQLQALKGTFKKSLQQRNKIVELINCIGEGMQVFQFSAYPNFSKNFHHEFQSQDKMKTIIFEEDIKRFSVWWEENVNCFISKEVPDTETQNKHDKVRDMLLAVWCTDKDKVDMTKCSLGRCIREIDERLKSGKFTYRRKNPDVVPAPPLVKRYLGLENLTKQQHDILQSTEKFLWINGPAGAGKTVILMAKIIQLIKLDKDAKAVLFVHIGWEDYQLKVKTRHYQSVFDKAEIKSVTIGTNNSFHTPAVVSQTIEEKKTEYQVMIVHMSVSDLIWIEDIISTIYDCHVFVDDVQTFLSVGVGNEEHYKFLKTGLELSHAGLYVWIGCDIAQCFRYVFQIRIVHLSKFLSPNQHTNLSTNLRNTNNLARVLDCIRQRLLIELKTERSDFVRYVEELRQFAGHYLHGPITTIHVQYSSQSNNRMLSIFGIVRKELSKFCAEDSLKVGLLVGALSFEDKLQLQEVIKSHNTFIELAGITLCYSSEWPAVVAVIELTENNELADMVRLYLAISRARVSCSVILYPELGKNLEGYRHGVYLLAELKKHCKLVLHVPK